MSNTNTRLANKFIFSHRGDRSVGIDGNSATVENHGEFWNQDAQLEFVYGLKTSFEDLWGFDVTVIFEHNHICLNCLKEIWHLEDFCDMPFYCSDRMCQAFKSLREEQEIEEQAKFQEDAWNSLSKEDQEDILSGSLDTDVNYFRDRNVRALQRINGAGVRC